MKLASKRAKNAAPVSMARRVHLVIATSSGDAGRGDHTPPRGRRRHHARHNPGWRQKGVRMLNPLRSETEVFWTVVVIAAGAGAVIALTLITRPVFGAILLAIELVAGSWALLRRATGTLPHEAEVAH